MQMILKSALVIFATAYFGCACHCENTLPHSEWDEKLLELELHDVTIDEPNIIKAWQTIATTYLLRANFYRDMDRSSDSVGFSFSRNNIHGKNVFEAFVETYPDYAYAPDKATGVIWIYPKKIAISEILSTQLKLEHSAPQISMYDDVLRPICILMGTNGLF